MASASGLSPTHRIRARDLAMQGAFICLRHAHNVHYTQSASRWQGIREDMEPWNGEYPRYADCSSFTTWCLWLGLNHYGVRDVVNGQAWRAGWTGTQVKNGKKVTHRSNVRRGDLVHYGDPFGPTGHVAIAIGGGMCISFGSEAGPFLLDMDYRPVEQVRRYV